MLYDSVDRGSDDVRDALELLATQAEELFDASERMKGDAIDAMYRVADDVKHYLEEARWSVQQAQRAVSDL